MIIINFKNYLSAKKALQLARKIKKHTPKAIVCPDFFDVKEISKKTKLKVFSQHLSSFGKGKSTGFVIPEVLKKAGGAGALLNHSEHRIPKKEISKTIKHAKKQKLKTILCVQNLKEAKEYKKYKPYAIAFEERSLIGTKKSITSQKPDKVKTFAKLFSKSKIIPLCGAGVNSIEDVRAAKALGCKGVLIASAIAKTKNPELFLKELSKL